MRMAPPGAIARLALLAVLTRLITPVLTGVAIVTAAVASVVALGATAEAPVADGPELLAVVGVVVVHVVEDAERAAALG